MNSKEFLNEEPDEILEGLYLGGDWCGKNLSHLQALKVTHVLTVAHGIPPPFPEHFEYKIVPIYDMDSVDFLSHFRDCHSFIDKALNSGGSILVHCHAGASRSATVVISYLMKSLNFGWEQALNFAVARRPVVCPNYGFLVQLQRYEELLKSPYSLLDVLPSSFGSPQHFSDSIRQIDYWYSTSSSSSSSSRLVPSRSFSFPLPTNKKGYHPNFHLSEKKNEKEEENIRAFFKKYGFVIIRNIVPPKLIEDVIDDIWDNYLPSEKDPRALRYDPSTWHYLFSELPAHRKQEEQKKEEVEEEEEEEEEELSQDELWTLKVFKSIYNTRRGFLGHDFASSQAAWDLRQHPQLYRAFSVVLGERQLNVKLDRYGLMRPTKLRRRRGSEEGDEIEEHPEWKTDDRFVHWDQNPWLEPEFVGVQGLVTLSDHNEQSGGFHCIPGFVHEFKDWAKQNLQLKKSNPGTLVDFPKWSEDLKRLTRLCMPKGSLLIWDSRTPHGNYPNDGFDWRMVMYVTMRKEEEEGEEGEGAGADYKRKLRELLKRRTEGMEISLLGRLLIGLSSWKSEEGDIVCNDTT